MALFRRRERLPRPRSRGFSGWVGRLLGGRAIENRVDESFPTWQEFSEEKLQAAQEEREAAQRIELPPHRVFISSPLHGNFLYFMIAVGALALAYYSPQLGPAMCYGAIGVSFVIALAMVFRDALFLHIEALRLEQDGDMINKHARGPDKDDGERGSFLRSFYRKAKNRKVFRSRLLQIHYQNVLRTFEQGNRRTWVDQDASIADLQTLLSQRGMKLVWTVIEVLPQLGLLGTLIGLMRMFLAFRASTEAPEVAVLAGFGTALGTTILANVFVLVLRPLYMRNERSVNEVLSTIQVLMATFILPTQQSVLERGVAASYGRMVMPQAVPVYGPPVGEGRLAHSLDDLTRTLGEFTELQASLDSGTMARETAAVAQETAGIAQEVKNILASFSDTLNRDQLEKQQRAFAQLTEAMQSLAHNVRQVEPGIRPQAGGDGPRIEHDLMQLRLLTHDTLLLLEQIATQLSRISGENQRLLSDNQALRSQVFSEEGARPALAEERGADQGVEPSPIRLFKERG